MFSFVQQASAGNKDAANLASQAKAYAQYYQQYYQHMQSILHIAQAQQTNRSVQPPAASMTSLGVQVQALLYLFRLISSVKDPLRTMLISGATIDIHVI